MEDNDVDIFTISEVEAGLRLDKILADRYREVRSRSYFQTLIENQLVLINGNPVKKRNCPKNGDTIEIQFQLYPKLTIQPESIPLKILYEDDAILVIDKPAGMVVHPAPGHWNGTLVNALMHHCQNSFTIQSRTLRDPLPRPGIVHRLDKETSGVIVCAKECKSHEILTDFFTKRQVSKEYVAICVGNPGHKNFTDPIGRHPVRRKEMAVVSEGGREAFTKCESIAFNGKLSYVHLKPTTGRTHQIRVHLTHNRTPILGDSVYGCLSANKHYHVQRQMLHAKVLSFPHPVLKELMVFSAEPPEDMQRLIKIIKS